MLWTNLWMVWTTLWAGQFPRGQRTPIASARAAEHDVQRVRRRADIVADVRGTRWAGYQAVTEYIDRAAPVHGKTVGDKAINRALRSIDGSVVEIKEKACAVLSA